MQHHRATKLADEPEAEAVTAGYPLGERAETPARTPIRAGQLPSVLCARGRSLARASAVALTGSKLLQNMLRGRPGAVQRHYDIGTDLFEAFLDPTMPTRAGCASPMTWPAGVHVTNSAPTSA
jgi:hypothetical protein